LFVRTVYGTLPVQVASVVLVYIAAEWAEKTVNLFDSVALHAITPTIPPPLEKPLAIIRPVSIQ